MKKPAFVELPEVLRPYEHLLKEVTWRGTPDNQAVWTYVFSAGDQPMEISIMQLLYGAWSVKLRFYGNVVLATHIFGFVPTFHTYTTYQDGIVSSNTIPSDATAFISDGEDAVRGIMERYLAHFDAK